MPLIHRGSMSTSRRTLFAVLLLVMNTTIVWLTSISVGTVSLSIEDIFTALAYPSAPSSFIVVQYRLPRACGAVLAGAALAFSGALLQAALRNPLASPDIVGVTKGAALGAFVAILLPIGHDGFTVPIAVVTGAFLSLATLLVLTRRSVSTARIALTGIAIGALCQAAMQFLFVTSPGDSNQAMIWLAGSLYGTSMSEVQALVVWCLIFTPIGVLLVRHAGLIGLDDISIVTVGGKPSRLRGVFIVIAVLLAAGAVAVVGSIGCLGLLAPHIGRRCIAGTSAASFFATALIGSILLTIADVFGRTIAAPSEIPAGIVTSVIGGAYLIHALRKETSVRI